VNVSLIQVPYHAGDDRHGSSKGPRRLLEAGAAELLKAQDHRVSIRSVDRGGPFRDTASSSAAVNKQVAAEVRAAIAADELPLVIAGSCVTCQGVLAGFDHDRCGVVWIDAHADFNTPDTAASGFFPGMSLAIVTGHCYGNYWAQIGDSTPIAEDRIVMLGVRDLWPEAERERLERSAITSHPRSLPASSTSRCGAAFPRRTRRRSSRESASASRSGAPPWRRIRRSATRTIGRCGWLCC
jgi:arginase